MKRFYLLVVVLIIAASLLAACSGNSGSQNSSSPAPEPSSPAPTGSGDSENGSEDVPFHIADIDIVIEALQNPDEWVVIDVRTAEEFAGLTRVSNAYGSGRIKGAVNVDRNLVVDSDGELLPQDEIALLYEFIGSRKAIVYCHGGIRSAIIRDILVDLGFETYHYDGSWIDWSWAASIANDQPNEVVLSLTEEWTDNEGEIE